MIVDLELAAINKPFVLRWYKAHGESHRDFAVSIMATTTGCPCITVAFWIGEAFGWPQHIVETIECLIKFYGYTEIKNMPANCPNFLLHS